MIYIRERRKKKRGAVIPIKIDINKTVEPLGCELDVSVPNQTHTTQHNTQDLEMSRDNNDNKTNEKFSLCTSQMHQNKVQYVLTEEPEINIKRVRAAALVIRATAVSSVRG